MIDDKTRADIVFEARKWLGTPYRHQASVCGTGADCLGLIRGVWRSVIGPEPEHLPAYSADWGEVSGKETMITAAQKWFVPVDTARRGDIAVFRWKNVSVAKHAGIFTDPDRFIHAYDKVGVVESYLGSQWRNRIVATYAFPEPSAVRT